MCVCLCVCWQTLYEGPLRKKNSRGFGRVVGSFNTRYFVLNVKSAALEYYDSMAPPVCVLMCDSFTPSPCVCAGKAKRVLAVNPRGIPCLSFYSVKQVK